MNDQLKTQLEQILKNKKLPQPTPEQREAALKNAGVVTRFPIKRKPNPQPTPPGGDAA